MSAAERWWDERSRKQALTAAAQVATPGACAKQRTKELWKLGVPTLEVEDKQAEAADDSLASAWLCKSGTCPKMVAHCWACAHLRMSICGSTSKRRASTLMIWYSRRESRGPNMLYMTVQAPCERSCLSKCACLNSDDGSINRPGYDSNAYKLTGAAVLAPCNISTNCGVPPNRPRKLTSAACFACVMICQHSDNFCGVVPRASTIQQWMLYPW
mmetsp:Transcript_53736/g.135704  ORF Transcript_53736/g.135704 Transcript_53736/m.135704 type:complete len:214 (+) Transcript_53736:1216-1857(+)